MSALNRVGQKEYEYTKEVLDSGFRTSTGSTMVGRFEKAFCCLYDSQYAIAHINGTATLHTLLEAKGIGVGDEVIVPPLTMSATTFAVLQANATPVFADVDPDTFQIDPASIGQNITTKTKAIITVALYGLSPDMDRIMKIAAEHNLFVIEDNAQCFLGYYKGQLVGKLGHAASFSFQSSKQLTSGEGGIVITDDEALADNVRRIGSLGYAGVGASKAKITKNDIQNPAYARHVTMGWNYRMPELAAAVALAQVENATLLIQQRIMAATLFAQVIADCQWLVPQRIPQDCVSSYWTYAVKLERNDISWTQFRDTFVSLGGDGIYAAWKLTYMEPMFKNMSLLRRECFISDERKSRYQKGLCPIAESIQPKLLQFKTNYFDADAVNRQAEVLRKCIEKFT